MAARSVAAERGRHAEGKRRGAAGGGGGIRNAEGIGGASLGATVPSAAGGGECAAGGGRAERGRARRGAAGAMGRKVKRKETNRFSFNE